MWLCTLGHTRGQGPCQGERAVDKRSYVNGQSREMSETKGFLGGHDDGRTCPAKTRRIQNGEEGGWIPPAAQRSTEEPFYCVSTVRHLSADRWLTIVANEAKVLAIPRK